MAPETNSTENKDKNDAENGEDDTVSDESAAAEEGESTGDEPLIIEGKAEEIDGTEPEEAAETSEEAVSANDAESSLDDSETDAESSSDDDSAADDADEVGTEDDASPEPETEQVSESKEAPPPPVAPSEPARTGPSVMALVFGGIVAGALGYFGAALQPDPEVPQFDATPLTDSIQGNSDSLAALQADVEGLAAAAPAEADLTGIEGDLATLSGTTEALAAEVGELSASLAEATASLSETLVGLDERILALETVVPSADALETGEELSALRTRIEEMTSEAEARLAAAQAEAAELEIAAAETRAAAEAKIAEAQAEAAARVAEAEAAAETREAEAAATAARQAALVDLKTAVEAGAPYGDALSAAGDVPAILAENAETGVPSLQSLQGTFPNAARQALASAEIVPADASAGDRLTAFLKRRTGARSLSPQDGDGPDAVLSRAEAELGNGDLSAALSELEALPEEGRSAMSDWLEQAELRLSVANALDKLTATN